MALFTSKADRKVPLLTQFCQLEILPTPEENYEDRWDFVSPELDRFLFLYSNGFTDEAYDSDGLWSQLSEIDEIDYAPVMAGIESGWNGYMDYQQGLLCEFLTLYVKGDVKSLTDFNEETGEPSLIDEFNNAFLSNQSLQFVRFDKTLKIEKDKKVAEYLDSFFFYDLVSDLADSVIDALKNGKGVGLCEECGEPYLAMKDKQRFCSTRCRQRQGQRIRMRRLFER